MYILYIYFSTYTVFSIYIVLLYIKNDTSQKIPKKDVKLFFNLIENYSLIK